MEDDVANYTQAVRDVCDNAIAMEHVLEGTAPRTHPSVAVSVKYLRLSYLPSIARRRPSLLHLACVLCD